MVFFYDLYFFHKNILFNAKLKILKKTIMQNNLVNSKLIQTKCNIIFKFQMFTSFLNIDTLIQF